MGITQFKQGIIELWRKHGVDLVGVPDDADPGSKARLALRRADAQRIRLWIPLLVLVIAAPISGQAQAQVQQQFPDVIAAKIRPSGNNRFDFDVTVSSPYDTAKRYADAFRVMGREGVVYGERILWHDHAGEQPFTRDLYGVRIPAGVRRVVIQGRDQQFGYGGKTLDIALPGR